MKKLAPQPPLSPSYLSVFAVSTPLFPLNLLKWWSDFLAPRGRSLLQVRRSEVAELSEAPKGDSPWWNINISPPLIYCRLTKHDTISSKWQQNVYIYPWHFFSLTKSIMEDLLPTVSKSAHQIYCIAILADTSIYSIQVKTKQHIMVIYCLPLTL